MVEGSGLGVIGLSLIIRWGVTGAYVTPAFAICASPCCSDEFKNKGVAHTAVCVVILAFVKLAGSSILRAARALLGGDASYDGDAAGASRQRSLGLRHGGADEGHYFGVGEGLR